MKTNFTRILIVGFLFVSNYVLQAQNPEAFYRTVNACYDQYRVYYDSQQYGLAIPPLKEMIQILDTTTVDVDELVINKYKSDGYYDLARYIIN